MKLGFEILKTKAYIPWLKWKLRRNGLGQYQTTTERWKCFTKNVKGGHKLVWKSRNSEKFSQ